MGHENGGKQRLAKRRHVQGMLDETDSLTRNNFHSFLDLDIIIGTNLCFSIVVYIKNADNSLLSPNHQQHWAT